MNLHGETDQITQQALAFGSLILDSFFIRLSGQDSGRGTFSQRHAVLLDQESATPWVPLQAMARKEGKRGIEVVNSPLSEYAVLGFEQGFSWLDPQVLSIWEAQCKRISYLPTVQVAAYIFILSLVGDFFTGAQIVIDTYWASGEAKWGLQTSLTLLLPHGYGKHF
jgi:probable 2-oxoglutarate dehydrogenase E1 component DHKTD1